MSVLPLLRVFAAIGAATALASCNDNIRNISGRHMQPLSEAVLAELDSKSMSRESPILIRVFKEESELELWKLDRSGRFALLRTYPICRWSGELGPKNQQGDGQAPEGFYTVRPGLMNPNSHYHLAINTGFPNAYDRANGRTGASLMIHGDCASIGCYAMTDEQISEIYSLAREAFFGGQRSFQIQAFPFRMTPLNTAKHRNSPHVAFWKVLKEGHDHFEVTRKEPKVAVCDKHYVFDAQSSGKFNPIGPCPAYKVPQQIASAVHNKQRRDEIETAQLISRGITAVSATKGGEGGMNSAFLSALRSHGGPGTAIRTAAGTIPANVHPPGDTFPQGTSSNFFSTASAEVKPVQVRVASGASDWSSMGAFFGNLFGSRRDNTSPGLRENSTQPIQNKPQAASIVSRPVPAHIKVTAATQGKVEPQRTTEVSTKSQASPPQQGSRPEGARITNLLTGAVPAVPEFSKIDPIGQATNRGPRHPIRIFQ
jgi:murein L,D-transpeptidase YafK